MKLIPRKFKKRVALRRDADAIPLTGSKGGRIKRQLLEARLIDKELRDYAYH
jgi:hypothetical protein